MSFDALNVSKMVRFFALIVTLSLMLSTTVLARRNAVIELNEDTWTQLLTDEWMVQFYAPWCPACKNLKPVWEEFSKWSDDLSIRVASIDVTNNPGLSGRFLVTALPTIYHVKDGVFRQYTGSRDANTLTLFVESKKWEKVDPIPFWKAPDSIQMGITSQLFKMSMALRSVHSRLVDDYGIPNWGTYVLFALAIILFGVLLGLMIVCIVDIICPPRHGQHYEQLREGGDEPVPSTSGKQSSTNADDDIIAEDEPATSKKAKKNQ